MGERIEINGLKVAKELHDFVVNEAIPGTGIDAAQFWSGFAQIIDDLAPKNRELLQRRDAFQQKLDDFYREKRNTGYSQEEYETFLKEIGYLLPEGGPFSVSTSNVDPEIAVTAGPQLVVPVMNARYALNAANARWGSLYDALYGTDAIPDEGGAEKGKAFNPLRGAKVIAWAKAFLDESAPLDGANWADVSGLSIENQELALKRQRQISCAQGRRPVCRLSRRCQGADRNPAGQEWPACRDRHQCRPSRSARAILPTLPMSCWNPR